MARFEIHAPMGPTDVLAWLTEHREVLESEVVEFVLPSETIEPAGQSLLACMIAARSAAGRRTTFSGSESVKADLQEHAPIGDLRTARRLADSLSDGVEASLPNAAPSVVRAARFVMEELGANIVQHSGRPETGVGCAAAAPERDDGRFQLAYCDAGIGFLASLTRHGEFATRIEGDADAIQLAAEKGLSSVGGRSNMGMGLGILTDLSDRLGADLWIVSGTAVWHRRSAAKELRVATVREVPRYDGAWICLDAPAFPR